MTRVCAGQRAKMPLPIGDMSWHSAQLWRWPQTRVCVPVEVLGPPASDSDELPLFLIAEVWGLWGSSLMTRGRPHSTFSSHKVSRRESSTRPRLFDWGTVLVPCVHFRAGGTATRIHLRRSHLLIDFFLAGCGTGLPEIPDCVENILHGVSAGNVVSAVGRSSRHRDDDCRAI